MDWPGTHEGGKQCPLRQRDKKQGIQGIRPCSGFLQQGVLVLGAVWLRRRIGSDWLAGAVVTAYPEASLVGIQSSQLVAMAIKRRRDGVRAFRPVAAAYLCKCVWEIQVSSVHLVSRRAWQGEGDELATSDWKLSID